MSDSISELILTYYMEHKCYPERRFRHIISAPFIYSAIIAFVVLDFFLEVYHRICFPLYGLKYVNRREYIRIDRHRLQYLNGIQKLNCVYCGYGNGLLQYAIAIVAETEKYWCSIKHKEDPGQIFYPPQHHKTFLPYGDAQAFYSFVQKKKLVKRRTRTVSQPKTAEPIFAKTSKK